MNVTAYSGYHEHTFYFIVEIAVIIAAKTFRVSFGINIVLLIFCSSSTSDISLHILTQIVLFLRTNSQFKDIFFDFYPCLTLRGIIEN